MISVRRFAVRHLLLVGLLLGAVLCPLPAFAETQRERLELRVVEVAGGRAYLRPGPGRGVSIDDHVNVGRRPYRVAASSSKHIVVELGDQPLARGQRAFIWASPHEVRTFATRPTPPSPAAFEQKWRDAARPAESQRPKFVPLGTPEDRRRNRAAFVLDHSRVEPLSGPALPISRTRLRTVLHAELTHALSVDADAAIELWQADDLGLRRGDASRPLLSVRQLELSYRGESLQAAIGRLRYAATTVGMLDGGRASASIGDSWAVAAFGGTLADPLDTSPETDAARFGAELLYNGEIARAPSRASLTLQGSRFGGRLDERRLTAMLESYPEFGRLSMRAEGSLFDAENPWGADPAELTAIGGDASFRIGALRLGVALETRRPERSYWLASFLPNGYFCVSETTAGSPTSEPCLGGDMRSMAALTAAWDAESWTLDAGATAVTTRMAPAEQATAFVHFQRRDLFGALRFDAGSSVSSGSLLESAALDVGLGVAVLRDALDASVYYRPNVLRYKADSQPLLEHGTGARLWWAVFDGFDTSLSADLLTGPDVGVLFIQAAMAWRPRF
jgi:hypothetical protein